MRKSIDTHNHENINLEDGKLSILLNYEQLQAVRAIEKHNVILLSGGPGTGKTNTIIRMIARKLLIKEDINIGLAAPTGKASRRLKESLEDNLDYIPPDIKDKFRNISCKTIHRWLGSNSSGFAKNKKNKLNLALLVVD